MTDLNFNDRRTLTAACGWIDLGLYSEAIRELESIPAHLQSHPDVVAVRWEIDCQSADWPTYLKYGSKLLADNPDDAMGFILLAEVARRGGNSTKDAYDILRPVADRFDDCLTVSYNLACFACQLGRLDESREWLRKTFQGAADSEYDGYYQGLAIKDEDLEPLWPEISKISEDIRYIVKKLEQNEGNPTHAGRVWRW